MLVCVAIHPSALITAMKPYFYEERPVPKESEQERLLGLDRLCSKLCELFFSSMLKELPYYALVSAYDASQESQAAYYAPILLS